MLLSDTPTVLVYLVSAKAVNGRLAIPTTNNVVVAGTGLVGEVGIRRIYYLSKLEIVSHY